MRLPRPTRPLRLSRRAAGLLGTALVAATLTVAAAHHSADGWAPTADTRLAAQRGPTNAGKVFRWGNAQWADDFVGPVKGMWRENRPRQIRNQHGMLTINGTAGGGDVSATLTGHPRRYGRWETRVRAEQFAAGHTPYRVVAELIPTSGGYHCGARSIVLGSYRLGSHRAGMAVRTLPNNTFTAHKRLDLRPGPFHTYAVEVTRSHISWFVDTHVLRTERRPAALSGATFTVRFRLAAPQGARMNPGRMQMDWVRYYTLERRNARSISAPQLTRGTYAGAC
jgi:hypothetical protein